MTSKKMLAAEVRLPAVCRVKAKAACQQSPTAGQGPPRVYAQIPSSFTLNAIKIICRCQANALANKCFHMPHGSMASLQDKRVAPRRPPMAPSSSSIVPSRVHVLARFLSYCSQTYLHFVHLQKLSGSSSGMSSSELLRARARRLSSSSRPRKF